MNKCSCESCLFFDQCSDSYPCEHYSPADGGDDNEIIEAGRQQFYADWFSYLKDAEASII